MTAVWLGAWPTLAQSTLEVNAGLQLNFASPGARSVGMGGINLPLTGDIASAVTNPAALTSLTQSEVAVEVRESEYENTFGVAGGVTVDGNRLNVNDVLLGTSKFEEDSLAYVAGVYPADRWALAFYRHELANYQTGIRGFGPGLRLQGRLIEPFPVEGNLALEIVSYGAAAGFEIGGGLSLGLNVSWNDIDLDGVTARYIEDDPFPADIFSPHREHDVQRMVSDDDAFGFGVGLLWDGGPWVVGASYRKGPELDMTVTNTVGRAFANAGTVLASVKGEFAVPDVYGVGVAWQGIDNLTVAVQFERVEYSDLTADIADPFGLDPALVRSIESADSDQPHLGIEYVGFTHTRFPVAFRVGAWREEVHRPLFRGDATRLDAESAFLATSFLDVGDDEMHYAAGIGAEIGERFYFDVGADFSDFGDIVSVGGGFRF
ncbi:MAG TPA: hypothetical protein VMT16_00760 [Thermoanaerobaculia bacterium]|nr:hypothetical protein [Thermoanaerobaculia bacterium]